MKNKILAIVRGMNAAGMQRHAFLIEARISFGINSLRQKLKSKYYPRYVRWRDQGVKNFYTMVKNHKK